MKKLKEKLKEWWIAERKNRPEEGTSNDMFPTNGGALTYSIVMWALWLFVFLVYYLTEIVCPQ